MGLIIREMEVQILHGVMIAMWRSVRLSSKPGTLQSCTMRVQIPHGTMPRSDNE